MEGTLCMFSLPEAALSIQLHVPHESMHTIEHWTHDIIGVDMNGNDQSSPCNALIAYGNGH